MKPHTGYALVRDGKLILFDARVPIYWRKNVAQMAAKDWQAEAVEVTIRKSRKRKAAAKKQARAA